MLNLKKTIAAIASAAVMCSSFTGITHISSVHIFPPAAANVNAAEIPDTAQVTTTAAPATTTAAPPVTVLTTTKAVIDYCTYAEYDDSPMEVGETRAIRFYNPATKTGTDADLFVYSDNFTYNYRTGKDTVYVTAAAPGTIQLGIREKSCTFSATVSLEVTGTPETSATTTLKPDTDVTTTAAIADYRTILEYDDSPMLVGEKRAIRFYNPSTKAGSKAMISEASKNISYSYPDEGDTVYITALAPGKARLYILESTCAFGGYVDLYINEAPATTTVNHISSTTPYTPTTTSAAPAGTTTEKQIVMRGTGVDVFQEVLTYPTKTIYNAGESLDLSGLTIDCTHGYSVMYSDGTGEYISNHFTRKIDSVEPDFITIKTMSYETGEKFTDEAFAALPGGNKYIITIHGNIKYKSGENTEYLYDTDISFNVYINKPGDVDQFIKIDNAKIVKFEYGSYSKGFVLEGYEPMSIDMDAAMNVGYNVPHMEAGDIVSAVIKLNTERNYVITGDFTVVESSFVCGDANSDGKVTLADSLVILQFIANEQKYPLTKKQQKAADCFNTGDGITAMDAMAVQCLDTGYITELPITELPDSPQGANDSIPE